MGRIITAIIQAVLATAQTALDSISNLTGRVIATGFALLGFGGGSARPAQEPVFDAPPSPSEILADVQTGQRCATIRDLDREGVRTVFEFARASEKERATYDLTPVRRADVQALLLRMPPDQLTSLTLAGTAAVRRFVLTGRSGVADVPSVPTAKAIELEEQSIVDEQLIKNLRVLKEQMAKPRSLPFTMPRM